ncbi:muscle M-line assembly protein unc-89 isoform X1 [Spatholobus suberectus]|nr:muscle M-line assembly protein unc-89 isoform X1 [Spatholobus suberectus]
MEEPVKEQALSAGNSASARPKLQRYALRSSSKLKENKPDAPDRSSESKRGLSTPRVSRSVGGLDFSGKDKSTSAKPPRRLSNPVKSSPNPNPKLVGNITPISETRTMRSGNGQGPQSRSQTPASDISRTSSRMKFNLLSSSSYWLNQIKLSESASKHIVSLGFFKLALEARCEPFQKMQDELKSYVHRHQLAELGEVKELLQSYSITENIEQPHLSESISQPQVSESISQVPEEGARSSDDEVHCSSSCTMDTAKLKPEPLDTESTQLTPVTTESTKKETSQKNNPGSRLRENLKKNSANSRSASNSGSCRLVKKSEKPTKQQTNKEKGEAKKQQKKSDVIKVPISPTRAEDNAQGNKENMDVQTTDEISLTEVA